MPPIDALLAIRHTPFKTVRFNFKLGDFPLDHPILDSSQVYLCARTQYHVFYNLA